MADGYLLVKCVSGNWFAGQRSHGGCAAWTWNRKKAKRFASQREFREFESSTWPHSPRWNSNYITFVRIRPRKVST